MKNKIKMILSDSVWSISGMVLMNAAAQLLVYPFWNRLFGADMYGRIVYLISLMNIISLTPGSACNYARITLSTDKKTFNTPYIVIMAVSSIFTAVSSAAVCLFSSDGFSAADMLCYVMLCCLTLWRSYSDIEYRLNLNYKGYFTYCLFIGIGYVCGIPLMYKTGIWSFALIPGELFGLIFIKLKGSVLKMDLPVRDSGIHEISPVFMTLCGSYFISNLIFNGDRILLNFVLGGTAVSVYYISSLFGKTLSLITTPFNSVISGYLARYSGRLSVRHMNILSALCIAASLAAAVLCVIASQLILPYLYPDLYPAARDTVFICSLSQTIYFSSNIVSVIILRFSNTKHQLFINIVYALAFILICIPLTVIFQNGGFYIGMLITSSLRLLYGLCSGYRTAFSADS
ncbi:MAG: lipopolysaccharide biosynthesis protein [Oscillospiraceae bacterium]